MLEIIAIAGLSGLTAVLGAWLALVFAARNQGIAIGIGFSVGVMVAISVFELIPQSLAAAGLFSTAATLTLGFGFVALADTLFSHQHFIKEKGRSGLFLKAGQLVAAGMLIHDVPEGFAIASAYALSPPAGMLLATAVGVHNIPEGFAMGVPFAIQKKRMLLLKVAFLSALAQLLGATIGVSFASIAPTLTPALIAFAAGAMLFVSIDELLPLATKYYSTAQTAAGVALGVAAYFALAALI
jgi:ZIP family zinc transporter